MREEVFKSSSHIPLERSLEVFCHDLNFQDHHMAYHSLLTISATPAMSQPRPTLLGDSFYRLISIVLIDSS
ncbi:hypothetical protein Sjap_015255 [Stephania japonica]|uniref:Uncharacterized protein n=1 Tax=Stephania japonica TaxID=461633 RepID=A0AAP0IIW8_9MAGN